MWINVCWCWNRRKKTNVPDNIWTIFQNMLFQKAIPFFFGDINLFFSETGWISTVLFLRKMIIKICTWISSLFTKFISANRFFLILICFWFTRQKQHEVIKLFFIVCILNLITYNVCIIAQNSSMYTNDYSFVVT